MLWEAWWVWVIGGFVLGVFEVMAPGYIFVGFAIGAVLTGWLIGFGLLGGSLPVLIAVFAVLSLVAWVALRQVLGIRAGQVKTIDRDINEN